MILFTVEPKYQFFRYSVINNLVCGENSVARLNSVRTFFINIYGNKRNSMWMCTWIIIGNFVMVRSFRFCFRNFRISVCDTQPKFEYLAYYIQWIWPNIWTHLSEINFLWVLNSIISVTRHARLSHSNEYCELIFFDSDRNELENNLNRLPILNEIVHAVEPNILSVTFSKCRCSLEKRKSNKHQTELMRCYEQHVLNQKKKRDWNAQWAQLQLFQSTEADSWQLCNATIIYNGR